MTIRKALRRRGVLGLLAFVGGWALVTLRPTSAAASVAANGKTEHFENFISNLYHQAESAAVVGRIYLREHPRQGEPAEWLARLCSKRGTDLDALCRCGQAERHAWIDRAIREDFAAGRVVDVQGWQLSETEVTLCALVAMR